MGVMRLKNGARDKQRAELPALTDGARDAEALAQRLADENEQLRAQLDGVEAERQRYCDLFEHAAVGLFTLDTHGIIVEANRVGARLLGATREALRGTPLAVHVASGDKMAFARHLQEAVSSARRRASCVVTCQGAGGAPSFDVQFETTARRSAEGNTSLRAAMFDATEQRRAERVLAERARHEARLREEVAAAERRFARMAAVGSLLAESLDLDETLARAARVPVPDFASFCAVDIADDAGRVHRGATASAEPPYDLPLDPYAPKGSAAVVRTGKPVILLAPSQADILALASEAQHLPLLWARVGAYLCLPLRARGRVRGAITLVRSTREGFSVEDIALADELARHAALVIDNALLYREAQEADRRKDEFLAMLGHELRNPLAAIVMAAGRLRWNGAADPAVLRASEVVERQSGRLARIVDDLLDISRITHGKIVLQRERTALGDAVQRAVESARPILEARRHELAVTAPAEPVLLDADPARVEQVLVNLLVNAARYTEPGGRISIEVTRDAATALARVRDNGAGIAPEMLTRIFEPFTRAGADFDRGDRGLGIGLTLSRGLAELHGGRLTASSAGLGRGSEFVLCLPLAAEAAIAEPSAPDAEPAPSTRRRLLVVEDEPDVAEMMRERLLALGHEVRVARDGVEAIEAALALRPELLLVDLGLPGMSGYEVARRLRREGALAAATFVALTGYGDEAARRRSAEAGFDAHFTKPIPDESLRRLLAGH